MEDRGKRLFAWTCLFLGIGVTAFFGQRLANLAGANGPIVPLYTLGIYVFASGVAGLAQLGLRARVRELEARIESVEKRPAERERA